MGENRSLAIDILKTVAIIGVLVIHTSSAGFLGYEAFTLDWYTTIFWGSLVRFSVPVFFMCSGALLLNKKEVNVKLIYTKYLVRIIVAMLVWAFFYEAIDIYLKYSKTGVFTPELFITAIKNILKFNQHFHFYYLHIILIVYAFLPITKVFTDNASKQQYQYAIFIWFALGIVFPFAKLFYPFTLLKGITYQYGINMTYSAIGYGILGNYLNKYYKKQLLPYALLFALGFAITFLGTVYLVKINFPENTAFWEGMSPGVSLMSAGLFGFVRVKFDGKAAPAIIKKLSLASFCVYLVHEAFNIMFKENNITIFIMPPIISIPLLVFVNLCLSYSVYFVLSKIPIVKKYLI